MLSQAPSHLNCTENASRKRLQQLSSLPEYNELLPAPFPNSTFKPNDADEPSLPLQLKYDMWTPIQHDRSLPPEAEVDWLSGVARIPKEWRLEFVSRHACPTTLASPPLLTSRDPTQTRGSMCILPRPDAADIQPSPPPPPPNSLFGGKTLPPLIAPHKPENDDIILRIADVNRETTVADVLTQVEAALKLDRLGLALLPDTDMETTPADGEPLALPQVLPPNSTVEAVDLFNVSHRIVVINCLPAAANSYWRNRAQARSGQAHNSRPDAPEHLGMLNNLCGKKASHAPGTNLPTKKATWKKLRAYAQGLAAAPTRCCFQCGMLNYPKTGDTITVTNISSKYDCRAYRVFRYYIKELTREVYARLPAGSAREDAERQVFLCEPVEDQDGCRVFCCNFCKAKCRNRQGNRTTYEQCAAEDLDLFDGHDEEGNYTSIGIGDEQPAEVKATPPLIVCNTDVEPSRSMECDRVRCVCGSVLVGSENRYKPLECPA